MNTIGWDVGGAHLKMVVVDETGRVSSARQIPCPLWRGLTALDNAFRIASQSVNIDRSRHAVTMTGELCDVFIDRNHGVEVLVERLQTHLGPSVLYFAADAGLIDRDSACDPDARVASANWAATASYVAGEIADCLLVDIGSTTADLVSIIGGNRESCGWDDASRMKAEELIYTGVVRTPVMALVDQIPAEGHWQPLMSERFATLGDVYVLTGDLTAFALAKYVHFETADGAGVTDLDCARRLGRMAGYDVTTDHLDAWRTVARYLRECQLRTLHDAIFRINSRRKLSLPTPIVGAGAGRFLARELARRLDVEFLDISTFFCGDAEVCEVAAVCAPAAALALMLRKEHE